MASRATLKVHEIKMEHIRQLSDIEIARDAQPDKYSPEDAKKDEVVVHVQTGLKFARLYGPAVGLGVLSIGAILASHGVMARRQVSLIAAYNILGEGYRAYRQRVVEELGEDADRNFHLGIVEETRVGVEIDENGKKKKVKEVVRTRKPGHYSEYSVVYDSTNPNYRTSRAMNRTFLMHQQKYANDLLLLYRHVFLNQVYEALGFPHTPEGAVTGWVLRDDPQQMLDEGRDGYISFGLYDPEMNPADKEFMDGTNDAIILDFNVDGIMWNEI